VNFRNNTFRDNTAIGLSLTSNCSDASVSAIDISNNKAYENQDSGIFVDVTGSSSTESSLNVVNNYSHHNNVGDGILILLEPSGAGGGTYTSNISNNTTSFNVSSGIEFDTLPASAVTYNTTLEGNTADYNVLYGILAGNGGAAVQIITASNNTLKNNNAFPVEPSFQVEQAGTSLCLDLTGNSSDTGYLLTRILGTFTLAPINAQDVNTGLITTLGTVTPVSSCSP
jgi:hypothetical protein